MLSWPVSVCDINGEFVMSHLPVESQGGRISFYSVSQEPAAFEDEQDYATMIHHRQPASVPYSNTAYQYQEMPRQYYNTGAYGIGDHHQRSPRQAETAPPAGGIDDYSARSEHSPKEKQLHVSARALPSGDSLGSYQPGSCGYYQEQAPQLDAQYRKRPNYKPSALRWPFLTVLLLALIGLMGLLAYGLRALPVGDYRIPGATMKRGIMLARQVDDTTATPNTSTANTTTSKPSVTATRPPEDFGSVGSVTVTSSSTMQILSTAAPDDFGQAGKSITVTYTASAVPPGDHGNAGTVVITESDSTLPTPTYVSAAVTTLIDSLGVPTYTSTSIPSAISTPMTTVLTNSAGQPTATAVTSVLATPLVSTITNDEGVATATVTSYPVIPSDTAIHTRVFYISYTEYFIGFFLPTLLSVLIAIPIRVLDLNAKLFQPWHELTHAHGASGRDSLCLETSGWQSVVTSVRSLFGGQALVFLTTTLVLCSSLLVPLSAEAVSLNIQGNCRAGSMSGKNCAYELSVFSEPAKATMGLLGFMVATTVLLVFFLTKWQSGVGTNPWSICGIAGLSQNKDMRSLFTTGLPAGVDAGKMPEGLLSDALAERRFKLDWFRDEKGGVEYGIVLHDEYPAGHPLHSSFGDAHGGHKTRKHAHVRSRHHLPFLMLGYFGRSLFLFVLLGMLALILYYNNTGGDTPFERFMDSESFGVKFLFAGIGVVITFFWSSFFSSKYLSWPVTSWLTSAQASRQCPHTISSPPAPSWLDTRSSWRHPPTHSAASSRVSAGAIPSSP